jgi:hypothetical protein
MMRDLAPRISDPHSWWQHVLRSNSGVDNAMETVRPVWSRNRRAFLLL